LTCETGGRSAVEGQIRRLFQRGVLGDLTDGQLLERFTAGSMEDAEPAFAALVGRHAPMVWRVCRRVLREPHDAEDAFQATFLVLVQNARSVRRKDSVASWLHGVAYRVACCARSAEGRRSRHENRFLVGRERADRGDELESLERSAIVHEELGRLSDPHRQAGVLCDLEELTHEQAAARLGWPVGTVKSRLARGRKRLRARLIRRGLAPASGLIATVSGGGEDRASGLAPAVFDSTIRTALGLSRGSVDVATLSTRLKVLVEAGASAMWWNGLRSAVMAAAVVGGLTFGGAMLRSGTSAVPRQTSQVRAPESPPGAAEEMTTWARNRENLQRIGLALHNYHQANGHFPAAAITGKDGKPSLSWRVEILPFIEDPPGRWNGEALLKQFHRDEPWDSPHNRTLLSRMPRIYASPRDRSGDPATTVYRGFSGPGAMFDGDQGVRLEQVADGPTRTLMVVEAADPVPWTKPEELKWDGKLLRPGRGVLREGEFAALFASGHVRLIEPRNLLPAMITRQGGEAVYLERLRINELPVGHAIPAKDSQGTTVQMTEERERPEVAEYSRAKTLTDALAILTAKLDKDGMQEFKPLLTEARVRKAIVDYVRGYEAYLQAQRGDLESRGLGSLQSSFRAVKPRLLEIAEKGTWPARASFFYFYTLGTAYGNVDGCWVRLEVAAEDEHRKPVHGGAAILNLSYGPTEWPPPSPAR
jgi:RNA polymerase sigma factor (sigma-70 family)